MLAECCHLTVVISSTTKVDAIENIRNVELIDVNDNAPEFQQANYSASVSEVGYGKCWYFFPGILLNYFLGRF